MIESIVKIIALQTAVTAGFAKAEKWFEKKSNEQIAKDQEDGLEMNRLFNWLQNSSDDKPSTSPINAETFPALSSVSTILDNVTPDKEESNPMTGFSNEMFEGNITFTDVITHQKIDELGEFNYLMSSITHEKMDDIIGLLENDEKRDKRARREKNEAGRDNMFGSVAVGGGIGLAMLGLPLLKDKDKEKEKEKKDKKDGEDEDNFVDTALGVVGDVVTSTAGVVALGTVTTYGLAKKFIFNATDDILSVTKPAVDFFKKTPKPDKPPSSFVKYAKLGWTGGKQLVKALSFPILAAIDTGISTASDNIVKGKPLDEAAVDGVINVAKEAAFIGLKITEGFAWLLDKGTGGLVGSNDLFDDESRWFKELNIMDPDHKGSNVFDSKDVREKVKAKYGDDVEAKEAGEKLWSEAENKYDAVDIGWGIGEIEDEEKLAGLSIEHLEALLTHQNWKKKDEDLITKILMAKQQKTEIDTSTFNDWIPGNQDLKFDKDFEATYQQWYADNEAKEKIIKEERKKERAEDRAEIMMALNASWLGNADNEGIMRTINGVTTPTNIKTEYAADRALPTMTEMQATLEKELDKTYDSIDDTSIPTGQAGTQEHVDAMYKIDRLEESLDALESMSAEEFNALTPNSDIMDSFYKAGTTEGSIFVHDSHLLDFLKVKLKPVDSGQQTILKQHGANIADYNQLTSGAVLAGQSGAATYIDNTTTNSNNTTRQGDLYSGPTTAHAPNLPFGNGGSLSFST
jgi:hypothetical protein